MRGAKRSYIKDGRWFGTALVYGVLSGEQYIVLPFLNGKCVLIFSENHTHMEIPGKSSTCSEECFSLAGLNLIRQSCVVLRETFVQLEKSFQAGITTLLNSNQKPAPLP